VEAIHRARSFGGDATVLADYALTTTTNALGPLPLVIVTAILNMEISAVGSFTVWFNGTKVNAWFKRSLWGCKIVIL